MGASSDVGTKYKQEVTEETPSYVTETGYRMEDSHHTFEARVNGKTYLVVAVADGHGSISARHGVFMGGREAADAALQSVQRNASLFLRDPTSAYEVAAQAHVREASLPCKTVRWESSIAVERNAGKREAVSHGTTLSTLIVDVNEGACHSSYVGDSLILVVPKRGEAWFTGRAHDAMNAEEVGRLLKAGVKKWRKKHFDMRIGPGREEYVVQLSRSLGHFGNEQMIRTPSVLRWGRTEWEYAIVATDGVWNHVSPNTASQIARTCQTAQEGADKIIEATRSKGGTDSSRKRDNATVCIVKASPDAGMQRGRTGAAGCCIIS